MKILETERLLLRQLTAEDAELMLELLNDPDFIRYVADRGVRTMEEAAEFIRNRMLPSYEKVGFGFYLVEEKASREPIGICGLVKRDGLDDVDIGFSIRRKFWRKGFAHEAAVAVLDYGRSALKLPRIVAITAPDNNSSMKLLEKLGLRFEKMIRLPGQTAETRLFV